MLTGDPAVSSSENDRWVLLDSLRLLLRIAGNLTVILPASAAELEKEVESTASAASLLCKVEILRAPDESALHAADAILNVGFSGRPALPWTSISSNGWIGEDKAPRLAELGMMFSLPGLRCCWTAASATSASHMPERALTKRSSPGGYRVPNMKARTAGAV